MGSPAWDKIPFEKMPEWKREEILEKNKKAIKKMEALNGLKCEVCGRVCKNKVGLSAHKKVHNK